MSWTIRCLWGCWKLDVKNKSIRSFVWQLTLFLMEKKNNDPPTNTSPFPKQQQQKLKQTNKTATTENPGSSTLWFSCFKTYRGTNLFFFFPAEADNLYQKLKSPGICSMARGPQRGAWGLLMDFLRALMSTNAPFLSQMAKRWGDNPWSPSGTHQHSLWVEYECGHEASDDSDQHCELLKLLGIML